MTQFFLTEFFEFGERWNQDAFWISENGKVDESFDSLLTVSDSGDGSGSGIGERVMTWRRAPSGRS